MGGAREKKVLKKGGLSSEALREGGIMVEPTGVEPVTS